MNIDEVWEKRRRFILGYRDGWTLRIDDVTPSGNVLMRMHWAKYKVLLSKWWWLVRQADGFEDIPRATKKRILIITRYSRGLTDTANRYNSIKPLEDILKPSRTIRGIFKTGKRKGQEWIRHHIGHGLILDDDDISVELTVLQGKLKPGEKPYTTIFIKEIE